MAQKDRDDARKWRIAWGIAWRIISTFLSIVNLYSYFAGIELRADSIWHFSPWPMEAVYLSLGLLFLLILIFSSLSIITPKVVAVWDFFGRRRKEREKLAQTLAQTRMNDALSTMTNLRALSFTRVNTFLDSNGVAYEKIHRVEMENLGLALPAYATPHQWVIYLDRLVPFVQECGLRDAKQEVKKWKWHEPPEEDLDDEVPF